MPAPKPDRPGKRINVWLPYESVKVANQIDNLSNFIQLALEQASAIMAFDIIKQKQRLPSIEAKPEEFDRWNRDHPLDRLTAKRKNQWPSTPSSPKKPELW